MIRTDRLLNAATQPTKWCFAVGSRLVTHGGKTIQHIVIFDDHPDSLQLLPDSDLIPRRSNGHCYAVLAKVLVLVVVLGMFWPLLR